MSGDDYYDDDQCDDYGDDGDDGDGGDHGDHDFYDDDDDDSDQYCNYPPSSGPYQHWTNRATWMW